MSRQYDKDFHSALVKNWREIANIPPTVEDHLIYEVVTDNDLRHSSSQTEDEHRDEIDFLRSELLIDN